MKLHWDRAPRVPRPPAWAMVLVGAWGLLVLGGVMLEHRGAPAQETCLIHRLTGYPCPTCGSTRVVLGFTRGAWLEAIRLNPLVALGLLLGGLWLSIRLTLGLAPRLDLTMAEHRMALILGLGALFANWIWVLRVQG